MAALEIIALDEATPQLRAPAASDTYIANREVDFTEGIFVNGIAPDRFGFDGDYTGLVLRGTFNTEGTEASSYELAASVFSILELQHVNPATDEIFARGMEAFVLINESATSGEALYFDTYGMNSYIQRTNRASDFVSGFVSIIGNNSQAVVDTSGAAFSEIVRGMSAQATISGGDVEEGTGMNATALVGFFSGKNVSVTDYSIYGSTFSTFGRASGNTTTITNLYQMRLVAPTVGATAAITNRYGIYQGGSTFENVLEGPVTFENANINCSALPTSDPAVAGQLWNDAGTLKISAG